MANQIVVSSGAKVRNLEGVLTGTSGVVSSVPLGAANGVATLDSGGKVPVSQLPSSVVTYLGTWNAATNTPTLVNGTGDAGDLYICNVAGTVNFGAGPIVFVVGDWVLYGSGTWQKSSGQNGTVTSVAASITGNSLGITGSPITTAGTLAFAFAGTNLQYVNGAGNLTTFPSLTGYVPYIGATADLNLDTYDIYTAKLWLNDVPNAGFGSLELTDGVLHFEDADGHSMVTMEDGYLTIANASTIRALLNVSGLSTNRDYAFPNASGTLALTSDISYPVTSVFARTGAVVATSGDYTTTLVTEGTNLYYTDVRARASNSFVAGSGAYNSTTGVITIPTNNNQITNGSAYITLGSLSATTPIFYNSTTGVISSQAASATLEGYVTTGTQTIAGLKAFNDAITGNSGIAFLNGVMPPITSSYYSGIGGNSQGISIVTRPVSTNYTNNLYFPSASNSYTFPNATGTLALTSQLTSGTVTSVSALTLGTTGTDLSSTVANSTTTPVITLNVPTASASNRGALSSADWTTFNGKFTLPSLTSGSVLFSNGSTISQSNANFFWDATNNRLGIGTSSPLMTLDVNGTAYIRGWTTFNSTDVNGWYSTMQSSGTAFAYLGSTGQFAATGGTATDFGIRSQNAIAFYTNGGNERMRITSAGNVGIGQSTPIYLLDLKASTTPLRIVNTIATSNQQAWIKLRQSDSSNFGADIGIDTTTGGDFVIGRNDGTDTFTEAFRIKRSNGNVGIGSSAPACLLQLQSSSFPEERITDGTIGFQMYSSTGGSDFVQGTYTNHNLVFRTNAAERMRITSGGNVGIGTTGFGDVRCAVTGVDTTSSNFVFICKNGGGTNLFNLRNDGWLGTGLASVSPYNNTSSSAANGLVYSDGSLGRSTSSIRYKKDVEDLTINTSDLLSKMRPVWYRSKCSNDNSLWSYYGFIAEELAEIEPRLIHWGYPSEDYNEQGKLNEDSKLRPDGVQYDRITVLLVAEIQKMNQTIQNLQEQINILAK